MGEHVEVGKAHGLTEADIERIRHGTDAEGWNTSDRTIVRAVEELLDDYTISDTTWAELASFLTEKQLVKLPGVVGAYTMTAMLYNSIGFALLDGNVGLRRT